VPLAAALVVPGGLVYVESARALATPPAGLVPWRSLRAGAVVAELLQRAEG
jgi:16S rRNA (guanine966-N2)-methyltransferase